MEIVSTESTVLLIDTGKTEHVPQPCFKRKTYGLIKNIAHLIVMSTQLMLGMLFVMCNKDYVECSDVMFAFMMVGFYIKLILILVALDLNTRKRLVVACTLVYLMCATSFVIVLKSSECELQERAKTAQYVDFALTLLLTAVAIVKMRNI